VFAERPKRDLTDERSGDLDHAAAATVAVAVAASAAIARTTSAAAIAVATTAALATALTLAATATLATALTLAAAVAGAGAEDELPEHVLVEWAVGRGPDANRRHRAPGQAVQDRSRHASMVRPIDWMYNQPMGRRSVRTERRAEITAAFARVLARHGYAGATIAAVAAEAGIAPGLVHHHFADKEDLLASLLGALMQRFRERTRALEPGADPLDAYITAAVALGDSADAVAARCWVGVLAEAVRDPTLFAQVRRLLDAEIEAIRRRGGPGFTAHDGGAVLAFIVGALVFGAFAPRKTAGFAAPSLHKLVGALRRARAT
jgi:TetR/AcrR family transcriptional repressor of bet genes